MNQLVAKRIISRAAAKEKANNPDSFA